MIQELSEIKKRRKATGLTQDSLSKLSGVSQAAIAKIEAGKIDPGYNSVKAIFGALEKIGRGRAGVAGDIANKRVLSVGGGENVGNVIKLLKRRGISQIPVIEQGKVLGSVSEKTILDEIEKGKNMEDLSKDKVENIMEPQFPIVDRKTGMGIVEGILRENNAILVSERGRIFGIITKSDLLKLVKKV